jgi:hypothetical protein
METAHEPTTVLSEFERRRVMRSFRLFLEFAAKNPRDAMTLIHEECASHYPYTEEYQAIFVLGSVHGALNAAFHGHAAVMEWLFKTYPNLHDRGPDDFIGDRRKTGFDGPPPKRPS